jgi:hypothetical protein
MGPWTVRIMAEQKMAELRADASRKGHYPAAHAGPTRRRPQTMTTRRQHLSEWAGYKIIGLGCRLARPAVVARVRAEL